MIDEKDELSAFKLENLQVQNDIPKKSVEDVKKEIEKETPELEEKKQEKEENEIEEKPEVKDEKEEDEVSFYPLINKFNEVAGLNSIEEMEEKPEDSLEGMLSYMQSLVNSTVEHEIGKYDVGL